MHASYLSDSGHRWTKLRFGFGSTKHVEAACGKCTLIINQTGVCVACTTRKWQFTVAVFFTLHMHLRNWMGHYEILGGISVIVRRTRCVREETACHAAWQTQVAFPGCRFVMGILSRETQRASESYQSSDTARMSHFRVCHSRKLQNIEHSPERLYITQFLVWPAGKLLLSPRCSLG